MLTRPTVRAGGNGAAAQLPAAAAGGRDVHDHVPAHAAARAASPANRGHAARQPRTLCHASGQSPAGDRQRHVDRLRDAHRQAVASTVRATPAQAQARDLL